MTEAVKHQAQRSESANTMTVRIAYPFLHKKRVNRANRKPLKTPRYDATLLIPKLHADPAQCANYAMLAKHCMDAATKAWGSWPQGGHWPVQDGDAPVKPPAAVPGQPAVPFDPNKYAWRKGNWVIEVTNYLEPGPKVAVLQNGQVIEIPTQTVNGVEMYKSGDYGIVNLCAYTFFNDKFGANFGFDGVLWTAKGDKIGTGGAQSTAQMFGALGVMSAAPALGPPGMPALPTSGAAQAAPAYSAPAPTMAPAAPAVPAYTPTAPSPTLAPTGMPTYPSSAPPGPPVLPAFPTR